MDPTRRAALADAYRCTTYAATTPVGRVEIHVGASTPLLDTLLTELAAAEWCFISACNPGSAIQTDAANEAAHTRLRAAVDAHGWPAFDGYGKGDAGAWPAERSLLIVGCPLSDGLALAHAFGQLAIVFGRRDAPASIVWTEQS